jgi:uncharacterized protein (TIGR02246 family)
MGRQLPGDVLFVGSRHRGQIIFDSRKAQGLLLRSGLVPLFMKGQHMHRSHLFASFFLATVICFAQFSARACAQQPTPQSSDAAAFEALAAGFQSLFNEGKAKELAENFLPDGELIDDEGNLYRGREELQDLFERFFATFPGAKLTLHVDSLRIIGPRLAIEEGTRIVSVGEGAVNASGPAIEGATTAAAAASAPAGATATVAAAAYDKPVEAHLRYLCVWTKVDDNWKVASVREFADDPPPTPHELLEPLAWLVGDWVSEGGDSVVRISYRWSDDGNFLIGDYKVTADGETSMDSIQRLGWDPLRQQVRSWLFDSDGGYGEGEWTALEDGYLIRSSAVMPDGSVGSANLEARKLSDSQFVLKGTNRIVAGEPVEDFEFVVSKQPPKPQSAR